MVAAIHGHTEVLVRDEYDCRGPESLSKCQHKSFVVIVHRYILSGYLRELMSIFGQACGIFCVLVAAIMIQSSIAALDMAQVAIHMCKNVSQLMEMQLDAESFRTYPEDRQS